MSIGERLRNERERLGLNQEAFAALAGAHRKSQGNYEKGDRLPDAGYLSAIAAVGVDVLYILTGRTPDAPAEPAGIDADTLRAIEMAGDELLRQGKLVSGKTLVDLVQSGRRYIRHARELEKKSEAIAPAPLETKRRKAPAPKAEKEPEKTKNQS